MNIMKWVPHIVVFAVFGGSLWAILSASAMKPAIPAIPEEQKVGP